ncbi:MAG: ATP-binding cassette domain-containing protein [Chitinivibrionales bacterium]|nr:ATP-binding cassette domain-containing protein [Chitinivibrionales bacterium]MBD3358675.1 ATP-binding cassette domain-containing protein [Chitinivibrionales bacterium]
MKGLRVVNLTKEFVTLRRHTVALRSLDLEVRAREFFVLLGPSGCGKSTLLNLIAGIERPTNGDIWLDEELFCSVKRKRFLSPRDRNIAMVFQDYALYPHFTVAQNIGFPLQVRRTPKEEVDGAVREVASSLGLESMLNSKPAELSGGQRQRVAIARAIIRRPNLFLLDEPLSNLDAQLRATTRLELKRLQRDLAVTTIYVTHDQIEAMTLGDRVAVLRNGAVEQVGTPRELYDNPANPFVGTFIGSPPMNLLDATFVSGENGGTLRVGKARLPIPAAMRNRFRHLESEHLVLGVRPEHIAPTGREGAETIRAQLTGTERLGRETLVFATDGEQPISYLVEDSDAEPGEKVRLLINTDKIHIFEADTSVARPQEGNLGTARN